MARPPYGRNVMDYQEFQSLTKYVIPDDKKFLCENKGIQPLIWWFAMFGTVSEHNGSRWNFRADQYTLPNGATYTRKFSGYVDKARGITKDDHWVLDVP